MTTKGNKGNRVNRNSSVLNTLTATGGRELASSTALQLRLTPDLLLVFQNADPLTRNLAIARAIEQGREADHESQDTVVISAVIRLPEALMPAFMNGTGKRSRWVTAAMKDLRSAYARHEFNPLEIEVAPGRKEEAWGAGHGRAVHRAVARKARTPGEWLTRPPVRGPKGRGVRALTPDRKPLWELRTLSGDPLRLFEAPSPYDAVMEALTPQRPDADPAWLNSTLNTTRRPHSK